MKHIWPAVPPAIAQGALHDHIRARAHRVQGVRHGRVALLHIGQGDDLPPCGLERCDVRLLVGEAPSEENLEKWVVPVGAAAFAERSSHLEGCEVATAQEI